MKDLRFNTLLKRYERGELPPELERLFDEWYQSFDSDQSPTWDEETIQALSTELMARIHHRERPRRFFTIRTVRS